jgi:hypothetical protein
LFLTFLESGFRFSPRAFLCMFLRVLPKRLGRGAVRWGTYLEEGGMKEVRWVEERQGWMRETHMPVIRGGTTKTRCGLIQTQISNRCIPSAPQPAIVNASRPVLGFCPRPGSTPDPHISLESPKGRSLRIGPLPSRSENAMRIALLPNSYWRNGSRREIQPLLSALHTFCLVCFSKSCSIWMKARTISTSGTVHFTDIHSNAGSRDSGRQQQQDGKFDYSADNRRLVYILLAYAPISHQPLNK